MLYLFDRFQYYSFVKVLENYMSKVELDGIEYDVSNATETVKEQLTNINFVNELILQKNNELQVAQTAKIGYSRALKRELDKLEEKNGEEN